METPGVRFDCDWRSVSCPALVLLIAAVVPSPLRRHPEFDRIGPDKFLHFLGHAWLTQTLLDAFTTDRRSALPVGVVAVTLSFAHGLVTGFLQRYVPGRAPERADHVAGLLGSVTVVLAWWSALDQRARFSYRD